MTALELALAILALFGHTVLWLGAFNRLHALPLPCGIINLGEKGIYGAYLAFPAAWLWAAQSQAFSLLAPTGAGWWWLLWVYAAGCWALALGPGLLWLVRPDAANPPETLLANHSQYRDAAVEAEPPLVADWRMRLAANIPGNQILKLEINHKTLRLPDLPEGLEGLTIVHLSDFHFTGRITRSFFNYVIEEANRLEGDLVAVTGDIVDKSSCIDWIPGTLGRLRSRSGAFAVLGNHDRRIRNVDHLRRTLAASGLTLLGGQWIERRIAGARVLLAGNERPWFGPAPDLGDAPPAGEAFRILLAHTPDLIPWARAHEFSLMLAGHNHGGQIRLPWLGPIVSPSRYGVRYAGGVYREGKAVLHVSRGVGALHPLRFNCPPELTRLTLTRADFRSGGVPPPSITP